MNSSWIPKAIAVVAISASLSPIWLFKYIPTQDGPAHLANSLILKDYGKPDNRFTEFYWLSWRPLPNWTSYAFLAGSSSVFPPLIAEKLLVSLYVIGFALAYRYFLGAVGNPSIWLMLAGFLLVFNRCFWLGFYNYCLSVVLFFVVVGFLLRRWEHFRWQSALALCGLFTLLFFTHLLGFMLATVSYMWIAITIPQRSMANYLLLLLALLPALLLTFIYFLDAGYDGSSGLGQRLCEHVWFSFTGPGQWTRVKRDVFALNRELFGIELHKTIFLAIGVAILYLGYLVSGFAKHDGVCAGQTAKRRSICCLGIGFAFLYFLLPNYLGVNLQGLFKARLAILPPLLWLSCCRPTAITNARRALAIATIVLVGASVAMVWSFCSRMNHDLRELTAGLRRSGHDKTLFFSFHAEKPSNSSVNPYLHAINYYCLESQNMNLGPNFTSQPHSVIRRKPGITEARGDFANCLKQSAIDVVVMWDLDGESIPSDFRVIFHQQRLRIAERKHN